jgi:DNA-binding transcriptional LysR family regulator
VTETPQPGLRVAFVPGVTLRKWTRAWEERFPHIPLEVLPTAESDGVAVVQERRAQLGFVRLPVEREGLSVIRLYGEVAVIVVPRDHEYANLESVTLAQVDRLERVVAYPPEGEVADAVELVGAGVGTLRLPHSLARLNARKDVAAIPIVDAPETEIALVWLSEETTPLIDEFVGIVRGRTAASSRSSIPQRPNHAASTREKPAKQGRGIHSQGKTRKRRNGR